MQSRAEKIGSLRLCSDRYWSTVKPRSDGRWCWGAPVPWPRAPVPRPGASVPRPGGNGARQWRTTTTPPAAAVGTHSSLLEFDTWRLALLLHLCPNKVLGAGKYAQPARLLGIEGFTPLLVVIQSEGLGSKCYTRIEAFLWHPSGKRFNKSNPQNSQNKMDFEVALKREMKLHFRPGRNISGQLTSTSLEMHSG